MHVTHVVNDLTTGGAQTLIDGLAKCMKEEVKTSLIVLAGPGPLSERLEATCSSVHYLNFSRSSYRLDRLVGDVNTSIKRLDPSVVHSHLLQSDLAVALAPLPARVAKISTVHTTGMSAADSLRSRLLGRAMGRLSSRFDSVVACGNTAAAYMELQKYDQRRASVIANGVATPEVWRPRRRTRRLLSLSRWHAMKDHGLLFSALAAARNSGYDYVLTCAGSGVDNNNAELVELIRSFGLLSYVRLLGPVDDVQKLFEEADALVISSAYGEALPMAGLEALSAGLPVLTTDVGDSQRLGVKEWMVVRPGDDLGMTGALQALAELSDADYKDLSKGAWQIAKDTFSIGNTARQYNNLYREYSSQRSGD